MVCHKELAIHAQGTPSQDQLQHMYILRHESEYIHPWKHLHSPRGARYMYMYNYKHHRTVMEVLTLGWASILWSVHSYCYGLLVLETVTVLCRNQRLFRFEFIITTRAVYLC